MPNIFSFVSYVLLSTFTPGPNNIMSMSNASKYGFKKSIQFNFGIFAGFLIIISLCSLFSVALYSYIPSIKPFMTFIGAGYMLYLAWHVVKPKSAEGSGGALKSNSFLSGLLLQFLNVKVILYGLTAVSTYIVPYFKAPAALFGFSVLLASIGFFSTCCWGLFGSVFQKLILKNEKVFNIIMCLLLVYCAVSLFL